MVLLRNYCSQIKPRILLAQTGNIDDSIRTIGINDIQRQLLHFGGEQRHLATLNGVGNFHGRHRTLQNQRHIKQKFTSGRKQVSLINRPEPQSTPVVHGELQTGIRAGITHMFALIQFTEDFILLADRGMRILSLIGIAKHRETVLSFLANLFTQVNLCLPQLINRIRKAL